MEVLKQERETEEGLSPMITAAAGIIIADDYRLTTPRAMLTAEGYDIRQTQGVNISAPHSTAISGGTSGTTQLECTDTQSKGGELDVSQDHTPPLIQPLEHLSRTFAQQAADFREQVKARMQSNRIDVESEEVSDPVEEVCTSQLKSHK